MKENRLRVRLPINLMEEARHSCRVTIRYRAREADAKSILQVLSLGVEDGEEVTVCTEGDGAEVERGSFSSHAAILARTIG